MNFRVSTVLCVILVAAMVFGVYLVKYQVQTLQQELASKQRELSGERESIHLLGAEWAYLTRPDRLEALQEKHLRLHLISSAQTVPVNASLPADALEEAPIVRDVALHPDASQGVR